MVVFSRIGSANMEREGDGMRLIDADGIKYQLLKPNTNPTLWCVSKDAVDLMPTVDAVPMVHGHWDMKWPICLHQEIPSCSCCKKFVQIRSAYCPNCGAKMDEVEE